MATMLWPNGLGPSTGDELAVNGPLYTGGTTWFVHYTNGTDAVSPAGESELAPLKTLAQAVTNAAHDDIIVLLDGHDETVTSTQTISKRLTIVGGGSASGKPTAILRNNQAGNALLSITTIGVSLRNIYFPENVQTCTEAKVIFTGQNMFRCVGCYFDCGAKDTNAASIACFSTTSFARFENCTFVSTATSAAARPVAGLTATAPVDWEVIGCTFDGGTVGFSGVAYQGAAFHNASTAALRIHVQNLTLLRGANFVLGTGATGYISGVTTTGSSQVVWP
jgi:hypothetical protein